MKVDNTFSLQPHEIIMIALFGTHECENVIAADRP